MLAILTSQKHLLQRVMWLVRNTIIIHHSISYPIVKDEFMCLHLMDMKLLFGRDNHWKVLRDEKKRIMGREIMQISFMGFYGGKNVFTFLNHGNPTFTSSYIPLPLLNDRDIDNCQTFEYYFSQRVILEQWYFRKRCVTINDTTFFKKLPKFILT